jgi:hypothetical protein
MVAKLKIVAHAVANALRRAADRFDPPHHCDRWSPLYYCDDCARDVNRCFAGGIEYQLGLRLTPRPGRGRVGGGGREGHYPRGGDSPTRLSLTFLRG